LINALLVAAILSNVARWPDHHRMMIRSRWFPTVYYQSEILKSSLRERRLSPSLNVEFGRSRSSSPTVEWSRRVPT
jgi:hypothetical protein